MKAIDLWKQQAKKLKKEIYAIYLACKDPRTPWYAKLFAACVVGYAFSPIDLIPDFIPILGYLDDLVLVPLGITIVIKMIPPEVLSECREKAREALTQRKRRNWFGASIIIFIWIILAFLSIVLIRRVIKE